MTVEEVVDDWDVIDGFLVYRPDVGSMRVGIGTVDGEDAWWMEVPSSGSEWNTMRIFQELSQGVGLLALLPMARVIRLVAGSMRSGGEVVIRWLD